LWKKPSGPEGTACRAPTQALTRGSRKRKTMMGIKATKGLMMTTIKLSGFTCLVVFLLLVPTVSAQGPADVQLSRPRFKQQQVINFNPRFSVSRSGSDDDDFLPGQMKTPPANMRDKGIYTEQWLSKAQATAHNSGSKTIKAIVWDYVFFA